MGFIKHIDLNTWKESAQGQEYRSEILCNLHKELAHLSQRSGMSFYAYVPTHLWSEVSVTASPVEEMLNTLKLDISTKDRLRGGYFTLNETNAEFGSIAWSWNMGIDRICERFNAGQVFEQDFIKKIKDNYKYLLEALIDACQNYLDRYLSDEAINKLLGQG